MKIAVFDSHQFEKPLFDKLNVNYNYSITPFEASLTQKTAQLATGFDVVCSYPNDKIDSNVLESIHLGGTRFIALRSAGFNHIDLVAANRLGIKVARVPGYSPYSVAEYATTLILALNRKICRSFVRVRELNFSLEGLVGFDMHGKTVGIIGTGRIGSVMSKIMSGFGCQVLAHDSNPNTEIIERFGVRYVSLEEIYRSSDIISLHVPLNKGTRHIVDASALSKMKKGVMLINTGRGGLIETKALIAALKSGQVGAAGLDVYEEEEDIFSHDLSGTVLQDDVLARLMTFPNVLITAHQAFLTNEALYNIVDTTLKNIYEFQKGLPLSNEVVL